MQPTSNYRIKKSDSFIAQTVARRGVAHGDRLRGWYNPAAEFGYALESGEFFRPADDAAGRGLRIVGRFDALGYRKNIGVQRPIQIRAKFFAANPRELLDHQAALHRNAARKPVGNRVRTRFAAELVGERLHSASSLDRGAECVGTGMESFRSHVYIKTHGVSFSKSGCELSV